MFRTPIRRTFHRMAKDGIVKAGGVIYKVTATNTNIPVNGMVTINTRGEISANYKIDPTSTLMIVEVRRYMETGIPRQPTTGVSE